MYTRKHFNFVRTALMLFFTLFVSSNAWAADPDQDKNDLQELLDTYAMVTLDKDYFITGYVEVKAGKTVTLNLNGHTIDRGLKDADAVADGYVIKVAKTGNLTITDTSDGGNGTITGGNNLGNGGGIYNLGTLTINGGTISGNYANTDGSTRHSGGGICNGGTLTINNGTISGNSCTATGGGVFCTTGSSFNMNGGTIRQNSASGQNGGGGIFADNLQVFTISGGTIEQNSVSGNNGAGGGIVVKNQQHDVTVSNCNITGNSTTGNGGGIFFNGKTTSSKLEIINCTITGNTAGGYGSDYYGYQGEATFEGCTFTDNNSICIYTNGSYNVFLADNADNSGMIFPAKGYDGKDVTSVTTSVTLKGRTLTKDGSWNTLCLPFAMTAEQVAAQLAPNALMELDVEATYSGHKTGLDGSTLYLYFKNATSIEAGKPYIVKWNDGDALVNPVFTGVTITSATPTGVTSEDGNVTFIGQYSPFEIVESGAAGANQGNKNEIILLSTGNKIGYSQNVRTIANNKALRCFRAHFYVPQTQYSAPIMNVVFNTETQSGQTTAINTVNGSEFKVNGEYYNLAGQRVAQPTKGLYIVNGRKVVVK